MRRFGTWRLASSLLLAAVLLASLGLRVWGSRFGLPAYTRYHPDEAALVERAARILWTGDWNLHRFNYPPFYAYIQASAYATYFLWGAARGAWDLIIPHSIPQYYHVGRLVTALMGTLTVLVVYLIGRELCNRRAGLLAALLLGGCYLHIIHSHYATFDVMVGLMASLVLLFSLLIHSEKRARWYALAGLCAGLAGATKYNGAVVLVVPLLAHALVTPWGRWGWLNGRLVLCLGGFLLGFFGGNPFALRQMPEFLNGLATVLHHYGTQHPGFEGKGNWRWYLGVFFTSADALWVATGLAGLVHLVRQEWRRGLLVAGFPVLYYLMVSRFIVRFERNLVPILPFLAVGGGLLLYHWMRSLWVRAGTGPGQAQGQGRHKTCPYSRWARWGVRGMAVISLVVVLAVPLAAAVSFNVTIGRTDMRKVAGRWLEENVPGGKIAIESYSIPFDHTRYEVEDVVRITDRDLAWYRQEGFDILVISDGVWEVLRQEPEIYAERLAPLDDLIAGSRLLAEFVPDPPRLVVAGYPTVAVYHFAPVRIYQVTR